MSDEVSIRIEFIYI